MKKLFITLIVLIAIMAGLWFWSTHKAPMVTPQHNDQAVKGISVSYACAANKTIQATFYDGATIQPTSPDMPPIPGGSAQVMLSDGRTLDLKQTISADGVRYSNGDPSLQSGQLGAETFVFWNKGNGALVLENNAEKSYIGCVQVAPDTTGTLPQVYSDHTGSFSLRMPTGFVSDTTYQYQLDPTTIIHGVKFTIPASVAAGTNLGSDSYVSVEQIPASTSCTANLFLDGTHAPVTQTDGDVTYSVSSAENAGAGNRYLETIYAIPGTNPCIAVRYLIHYAVFENYPAGTVKEFDQAAITKTFDAIRRTLVVNQ